MKVISWNVNGIRAVLKKGFLEFLDEHQPDMTEVDLVALAQLDLAVLLARMVSG